MVILEGTSHLDHSLTKEQIDHIMKLFGSRQAFFIETIELPEHLGLVPCSLVGPIMGDAPVTDTEVKYDVRGSRKCASRMLLPLPTGPRKPLPTNKLTVIAGPDGDEPCVLYTAFGGPVCPREPGDPDIDSWEGIQESRAFWSQHALI